MNDVSVELSDRFQGASLLHIHVHLSCFNRFTNIPNLAIETHSLTIEISRAVYRWWLVGPVGCMWVGD
ncbi:hypothetical protein J6590_014132 [Homalodisca vitripennis]|nr:hypothetical protein J6590_014132 [Homalodisca vitripennis]